jgi:hypothetical protein
MNPLIVTVANHAALPLVWDFLAPSLALHAPSAEFRVIEHPQPEEMAFGTDAARAIYVDIAREILRLHEDPANDGRFILSLGADTQLLAPVDFEKALGDAELLTMHDVYTHLCGCIIGMRGSERARNFYRRSMAIAHAHPHMQFAQAYTADEMRLKLAYVPGAWTTGYARPLEWDFQEPLPIPETATLHHANFVVGMERKRMVMEEARSRIHFLTTAAR